MSLPFFFRESLSQHETSFTLSEDTSKHIVQVLRMQEGEHLQLTDGKGSIMTCYISEAHKKKCTVVKISSSFKALSPNDITIAISLIKNASRFEWFLEKATEIGVRSIIPLLCERTEKQHFRFDRMNGILISAMLQSKQCFLPELKEPLKIKSLLESNRFANKYIAHCDEDGQKTAFDPVKKNESSIMLIGPEGDFTKEEILLAKLNGFVPVSLGNNRLRTETAGVVAAVMMNSI